MFGHEQKPLSDIQTFAHIHPFYSLITVIVGPALTFGLAPEFAPLLLVSFLFVKALVKEFEHVKDPAHKTKSLFREETFTVDDVPMGRLTHYESQPVVEAYPIDGHLRALTKSRLLAPYLLEFHIKYLGYLFALVNTAYGAWSLDPEKAAVKYINAEISRRGLNLEAVDADIYYMCKEIFKILKEYNQKAPFYLQRSEDEFDMDYCRALAAICDVAKGLGAEGCSTSIMLLAEGVKGLAGNLDWFNMFKVFHQYLVNIVEPTAHFRLNSSESTSDYQDFKESAGKPEMTLSSTIPGIIPAITVFNNRMLVVVYNEVGAKKGNRQNGLNAWSGMILARKIAEECTTMEEVVVLLQERQPASACNLIIAARDQHAVLQCMQYGSNKPFDMISDEFSCVATNHFIRGSQHMMRESAPIPDSKERHDKMTAEAKVQLPGLQQLHDKAVTQEMLGEIFKQLRQVAVKPTTKQDTVKTILAWLNYKENRGIVRMNTANFNASFAPDERGELHFDTLDLVPIFKAFRDNVAQSHRGYEQSSGLEKKKIATQFPVDQALIHLMQTAHRISQGHPALANELRHFCTALIQELSQSELFSSGSTEHLSTDKIKFIAEQTEEIVNSMLDKSTDKAEKWLSYKIMLEKDLPKAKISYHPAKIPEALFRVGMCVLMDATLKYLAEKSPSIDFASSSYTAFVTTLWEKIPQYGVTLATSMYLASQSLFKAPSLRASAEKVIEALKEKLPEAKDKPSILSYLGFRK